MNSPTEAAPSFAGLSLDKPRLFGVINVTPDSFSDGGDALARLRLRCDEIAQSLDVIAAAGRIAVPQVPDVDRVSGEGAARIETPRGAAQLRVKLTDGRVVEADLDTPSDVNIALVETVTAQQELGDALAAVASLDLSPWEVRG